MIQIKSIQLSWVDVAKAVSSELQKLLGRCFYCIASMDDHDYWGISIQNDRVDLAELDFVFDTVEAEDRVREDTYCDDGDVSFNALHMILTVRRVSVKQIIYLSTLQQMNFLSCAERLNAVSFAICCRIRKKVEIKLHFISALEVLLQKSWQSKAALEKME